MTDWRSDPGWRVVEFNGDVYTAETVPAKPVPAAELAPEELWASEYRRGYRDPVATWFRELPIGERLRRELARRASTRRGDVAPGRPVR